MKYVVLLFKLSIFVSLILIRLGEWDVSWLYAGSRYNASYNYYVQALAGLAVFLMFLDFVQFFVVWWYRRRHSIKISDNFIVGVGHIYSILLFFGLVVGVLSLFRIHPRELFTSLSIIFAGLAILSKDYISNLINGMIITFSGQISIGDSVSIGTNKGKVIDITLQNIHLLNDDDDMIYVPNNLVLNMETINYTKREIKRTSVDFEIDLKHLVDVEELEQNLIQELKAFHDRIKPDSYYLRVAEVKKDYVLLKFQYILNEPNKELERIIRRKTIRHLVKLISKREKVADQIPDFPEVQQDFI